MGLGKYNGVQFYMHTRRLCDDTEGPEKATRGGEWEPIKIPQGNSPYIPKSTRRPSLLTRSRPHSYRKVVGPRNRVRNHSGNMRGR
jgi:hypothetical protein